MYYNLNTAANSIREEAETRAEQAQESWRNYAVVHDLLRTAPRLLGFDIKCRTMGTSYLDFLVEGDDVGPVLDILKPYIVSASHQHQWVDGRPYWELKLYLPRTGRASLYLWLSDPEQWCKVEEKEVINRHVQRTYICERSPLDELMGPFRVEKEE